MHALLLVASLWSGVTTVEAYLHMLRSRSRCLLLARECRVNQWGRLMLVAQSTLR